MQQRPSILILQTDQQRWDALGASGNDQIRTPNLDRLASEGIDFTHHFVQNPVCMPSRLSFLTGQYPSTLRVTHMGVPAPEDVVALPRMLRNYGYCSGLVGKLHFLPHANRDHRRCHPDYGFDQLEVSDEPGCYEDAYRAWVRRVAPEQLPHISIGLPPAAEQFQRAMGIRDGVEHPERHDSRPRVFAGSSAVTHSAFVADRTLAFLQQRRERPFFFIAGFYSPHLPLVAPREFLDRYDPASLTPPSFPPHLQAERLQKGFDDATLAAARQGYYAMVSEVDHHVGRILNGLADAGLADHTIVVFTSDHGEYLGEQMRWGKGYPGHECVHRVPLIVRYPQGIIAPGRRCMDLVEAVDVAPTLLECCGIPIPPHLQGRSLWPVLRNHPTRTRRSALLEHTGWRTLRTSRYRYVLHDDGRELLWDLDQPLGEYHDLAASPEHADTLAAMRLEMARRMIELERPLPRTWPY